MSTGDKICKHGLWIVNCRICNDPSYIEPMPVNLPFDLNKPETCNNLETNVVNLVEEPMNKPTDDELVNNAEEIISAINIADIDDRKDAAQQIISLVRQSEQAKYERAVKALKLIANIELGVIADDESIEAVGIARNALKALKELD